MVYLGFKVNIIGGIVKFFFSFNLESILFDNGVFVYIYIVVEISLGILERVKLYLVGRMEKIWIKGGKGKGLW